MSETQGINDLNPIKKKSLVFGYIRQQANTSNQLIPHGINKLILALFNENYVIFHWNLEGKDLQNFFKARHNVWLDNLETKCFQYKNTKYSFYCVLHPNGCTASDKGYVRFTIFTGTVFLQDTLTIYHELTSTQSIFSQGKGICLIDNDSGKMWGPYCMKLADLKKYKSLQFHCYLEILEINRKRFNCRKNKIIMKKNIAYKWEINSELLTELKVAYKNKNEFKTFYSPNFDNGNWFLLLRPNGSHRRKKNTVGKCYLGIRLARIAERITGFKLNMNVRFNLNGGTGEYQEWNHSGVMRKPGDAWSTDFSIHLDGVYNLEELQSIMVDIQILEVYVDDKIIKKDYWRRYGVY